MHDSDRESNNIQ